MTEFSAKTIYVTGGARGMGLMTAQLLAARGANIVIFNSQLADDAVRKIEAKRRNAGQRVASFQLDVGNRDQVLAVFAEATAGFGAPDMVINMAGIGGVQPMTEMSYETFDRVMKVNVYGSRNVAEAALVTMLPAGKGKIVLIGSMGGFVPVYGYTAYGTSKFAVVGFAQCLRYELKPRGIGVACFCPGEVDTPGLAAEKANPHPAATALKKIGGTMPVERAVGALVRGIERDRFLIVPGLKTSMTYWSFRLTPLAIWNGITDAIVARSIRSMH